jgi:prephenate dehydrogenase
MHFNRIVVVGVGLIGASFALAARRLGLADRISGVDQHQILEQACSRGIIDDACRDFTSGSKCDAEFVYLSAPVGAIGNFLKTSGGFLRTGAIVTDSGSTKREICSIARGTLPADIDFVGGHPIAGSERSGLEHASADLFRGAPYVIVRSQARLEAFEQMKEIAVRIGSKPIELEADAHDHIVARVSHAPQLLATALSLAVGNRLQSDTLEVAGNGLTEMTRLGRSAWSIWEDICRSNSDEIVEALNETLSQIEGVRDALSASDFAELGKKFKGAADLVSRLSEAKTSR